jgi:hypothetical protein
MTKSLALPVLLACIPLAACGAEPVGNRPVGSSDTPVQRLNRQQVPDDLRHLVPLAERWGIGDDVERIEKVDRATPAEREELRTAVEPVHARITAWLDTFGQRAMSDEAAAFMYMQLALEEMRAGTRP